MATLIRVSGVVIVFHYCYLYIHWGRRQICLWNIWNKLFFLQIVGYFLNYICTVKVWLSLYYKLMGRFAAIGLLYNGGPLCGPFPKSSKHPEFGEFTLNHYSMAVIHDFMQIMLTCWNISIEANRILLKYNGSLLVCLWYDILISCWCRLFYI